MSFYQFRNQEGQLAFAIGDTGAGFLICEPVPTSATSGSSASDGKIRIHHKQTHDCLVNEKYQPIDGYSQDATADKILIKSLQSLVEGKEFPNSDSGEPVESSNPKIPIFLILVSKYGKFLNAENGAYFNDLDDARRAMYINTFLGQKGWWEYGSFIADTTLRGSANPAGRYYVGATFSNFMVGLPISTANGATATTDFEADNRPLGYAYWLGKPVETLGPNKDAEGNPQIQETIKNWPDNAILEDAHRHPSIQDINGFDYAHAHERGIVPSVINTVGQISKIDRYTHYDTKFIPRQDLVDLREFFSNQRQ